MSNFWKKLPRPFFALAPMYDVTDSAFRQVIAKYGRPDVFFTEFVSADGLASEAGRGKLKRELYFTPNERPIVAQIFGAKPETIKLAAKIIADSGFDGLDINLGCPDRAVIKQGAGAALIKQPQLALKIIQAAKAGAPNLPVSVKTRIGYAKADELARWTEVLLSARPAAITFHLRTMKELSLAPAHWALAKIPVSLARGTDTLIIGNGDVKNVADGLTKVAEYGVDGIMIGRGAFGNPWFFTGRQDVSLKEKLQALVLQAELFENLYGPTAANKKLFAGHTKNFVVMKKHFKAYLKGFQGAGELRHKLMLVSSADQFKKISTDNFDKNL